LHDEHSRSEVQVHIHLAGHLAFYEAEKRSRLSIDLARPIPLSELLRLIGVPAAEIAIAALNGATIDSGDTLVGDGDRLDLYPPVGGGRR
jgi:molybdopterin converting factor small subunit